MRSRKQRIARCRLRRTLETLEQRRLLAGDPGFESSVPLEVNTQPLFAAVAGPWQSRDGFVANSPVVRESIVNAQLGNLGLESSPAPIIELNLFDNTHVTAVFDRIETNSLGSQAWIGHVDGVELSQVVLVKTNGLLAGSVATPDAVYQVRPLAGTYHVLEQIDQSKFPDELDPIPAPDQLTSESLTSSTDLGVSNLYVNGDGPQGDDPAEIVTVLVPYSPEARIAAGGTAQIQSVIAQAVAETNQSYLNSGVNHRLQLVHTMETDAGDSQNDFSIDLLALRNLSDGIFDDVDVARETYFADVVGMIIENGTSCGLGYVDSNASNAFSVTHRSCATGNYSFGHEIGHNMGARHDWYVDDSANHHHGFVNVEDNWRTVMAYSALASDQGTFATRLPYWSNPELSRNGDPMGIVDTGPTNCVETTLTPDPSTCAADNRLRLNQRAQTVANFRDTPSQTTVEFSLADSSIGENDGTHSITVSLSIADGTTLAVDAVFDVSVSGGDAIGGGTDFTLDTTQVIFAAGSADGAAEMVSVTPSPDGEVEGDETVELTLAINSGAAVVGSLDTHTLTVIDEDIVAGTAEIHGQKWNDINGDGARDVGETGLNGWLIELYDDQGNLVTSQVTSDMDKDNSGGIDPETERGLYWFTGLPAGTYTVRETQQPGWIQTSPSISSTDPNESNVSLLNHFDLSAFPGNNTSGNDITGYVSPSGREYAIIGLSHGTGYVEVTNPTFPVIVGFIPGADEPSSDSFYAHSHGEDEFCSTGECGGASTWRDIKTYGQYAYVTNETSGGLQTVDLTQIDSGTVTAVGTLTASGLQTSHNIAINPATGFAYLTGSNIASGGLVVVDVATNPTAPTIVGTWSERYLHDAEIVSYTSGPAAGQEIVYGFAEGAGVKVIDVTDKSNMTTLATSPYPNVTYSHYGTLSDDLQYLFVNDELDELQNPNVNTTTTYVFDVSTPATPVYLHSFTNGLPSIDHNLETRGDFLFEANYTSGLRIFDISDVNNITETGYYDTYPANDATIFAGAWGVYTDLPSGTVLVSDFTSGLYLLDASAATTPAAPDESLVTDDEHGHEHGHDHKHNEIYALRYDYMPPQSRLIAQDGYLTGPTYGSPIQIAMNYLTSHAEQLGLDPSDLDDYVVTDQYVSENLGVTHLYLRQMFGGLEVYGADINLNITDDGRVVNVGSSFIAGLGGIEADEPQPTLSAAEALVSFASHLDLPLEGQPVALDSIFDHGQTTLLADSGVSNDDIPATLLYVPSPEGGVQLAWRLNVQTIDGEHWYDASVNAGDGSLMGLADWVAHASYRVLEQPKESLYDGPRTLAVDPADPTASPLGWHDTDGVVGPEFTVTRGNNVHAYADRNDDDIADVGSDPDGGSSLLFDFPIDVALDPSTYQDAAVTNLFYWNNVLHDIHYAYGFDEAAGNFQTNNYGNGGAGNDAVQAQAQDGADAGNFNNANFATPPDGFAPTMQMYVFTAANPDRDGDLDTGIIAHEYGHGVSNRLTGGPSNASALTADQSRGMGEGWSDWHGLLINQNATDAANDAIGIGTYALNQSPTGPGVRSQRYSYDMSVNTLTYAAIATQGFPHGLGEVWAATLWDLNWALIDGSSLDPNLSNTGLGFDPDLYNGTGGNNLAMQLVMDGMKLQPANPSFLDARDAILAADQLANGGSNQDTIWKVFARRGMGFSADDGGSASNRNVTEAFDLPTTSTGIIELDATSYQVGDTVMVSLRDSDLAGSGTINIPIASSGGDSEVVTLTEAVGALAGTFAGSIGTASLGATGDGTLNIADGDTITVTYNDTDDGSGSSAVVNDAASIVVLPVVFVENGSFETGDFTGWTVAAGGTPYVDWTVSAAGDGTGFGLDQTQPSDGSFVAWNAFDGSANTEFTLYQDVTIPAGVNSTLQWSDRVQWDFTLGAFATLPRTYQVQLLDPNTGTVLRELLNFSTGTQADNVTGDTDWNTHMADVSSFAGTTVRLMFREDIPQQTTGPAQIEFDDISLEVVATKTHTVILGEAQHVHGVNFGNHQLADYGDAPESYDATLIADNGASHLPVGPQLGPIRDAEADGLETTDAGGDDDTGLDDEDGVMFGFIGEGMTMAGVNVDLEGATEARVDAWLDFDGDGIWQLDEKILDNELVSDVGEFQTLNFPVTGAVAGDTYARVRISTAGNLSATGPAVDGEVEDYLVTIAPAATVVGRSIAYGGSTGFGSEAIDPSKTALQSGDSSEANYTNYTAGLNRVLIDIENLPTTALTSDDFDFRVGNSAELNSWQELNAVAIPQPTISVTSGPAGSDRVMLDWPDGAITNTWLQVRVRSTNNTGLAEDDVFYFGNQIADVNGGTAVGQNVDVNATDVILTRFNQSLDPDDADITNDYDITKDGLVNATDVILMRFNQVLSGGLLMITVP